MIHKAWCNIEDAPYYFFGSSIKFQGHTGWKIDNLNPIWVRLQSRSQLSNPSDLPCLGSSIKFQGHTGWKIDNLNSIWIRLLSRSQLSNPSDLPCLISKVICVKLHHKISSTKLYRFIPKDPGNSNNNLYVTSFLKFWKSIIFSCDQAALWMVQSICPSVTPF